MAADQIKVSPQAAHKFTLDVLQKANVPEDNAKIVADCLIRADLRGVDTYPSILPQTLTKPLPLTLLPSHGINRLPGYIKRLQVGVLAPSPTLSFDQKSPVMASLDAQNTFGFVAAYKAIDHAVSMAATFGVGIVGVKNSNHFGMAANYLLRAIEKGYAAMVFTNASRSMPAWGSKEPLLGTSPFAVGLPGGDKGGFVLDMSPSVVARGKVRKAARRNESIPEGWMLDSQGQATTDPVAALAGTVLPIGGPKGSGIAMMMDIFGGLLTGSAYGGDVKDQFSDFENPQRVGHWFMVFRPDMFLDSEEQYRERMEVLVERVRASDKAAGVERIFIPGEIEAEKELAQKTGGIPYTRGEVDALHQLADQVGSDARLV